MMNYLLDTNAVSDITASKSNTHVIKQMDAHRQDALYLCEAVDYEIRRGYLKTGASTRLQIYDELVKPKFQWVSLTKADWIQAAHLWADAAKRGKALSDVDLLIAAVAYRLGAIVVSADADFDELPIQRENWRHA